MRDKLYDNADSFAMSFDEEWKNIDCEDLRLKIDKVFELLSDHPFLVSNPENARKMAEFRIFSLKKFKQLFYFFIEINYLGLMFKTKDLHIWRIKKPLAI